MCHDKAFGSIRDRFQLLELTLAFDLCWRIEYVDVVQFLFLVVRGLQVSSPLLLGLSEELLEQSDLDPVGFLPLRDEKGITESNFDLDSGRSEF